MLKRSAEGNENVRLPVGLLRLSHRQLRRRQRGKNAL